MALASPVSLPPCYSVIAPCPPYSLSHSRSHHLSLPSLLLYPTFSPALSRPLPPTPPRHKPGISSPRPRRRRVSLITPRHRLNICCLAAAPTRYYQALRLNLHMHARNTHAIHAPGRAVVSFLKACGGWHHGFHARNATVHLYTSLTERCISSADAGTPLVDGDTAKCQLPEPLAAPHPSGSLAPRRCQEKVSYGISAAKFHYIYSGSTIKY